MKSKKLFEMEIQDQIDYGGPIQVTEETAVRTLCAINNLSAIQAKILFDIRGILISMKRIILWGTIATLLIGISYSLFVNKAHGALILNRMDVMSGHQFISPVSTSTNSTTTHEHSK